MVLNILIVCLVITGIIIFLLELILSIKLFPYSGGLGFVLFFIGTYLLSYKISKQRMNLRKKDLEKGVGDGSPGAGSGDGC